MSMSFDQAMTMLKEGRTDELVQTIQNDANTATLQSDQGVTLLMMAAYFRNASLIDHIRQARTAQTKSLSFHEAAALGDIQAMSKIAHDQPIDTPAPDGFTGLHLAVFFGHLDALNWLLTQKADIESRTPNGITPLISAIAGRALPCVQRLLEAGADVHVKQDKGFSPLMSAAVSGDEAYVDLILQHGGDRKDTDDEGKTAADHARSHGHEALADRLQSS